MPFLDVFLHYIAIFLFGARKMKCFPSPGALLPKDRESPKRIAAMERNGMVKNMQDTHHIVCRWIPDLVKPSVTMVRAFNRRAPQSRYSGKIESREIPLIYTRIVLEITVPKGDYEDHSAIL